MLHPSLRPYLERWGASVTPDPAGTGATHVRVPGADEEFVLEPGGGGVRVFRKDAFNPNGSYHPVPSWIADYFRHLDDPREDYRDAHLRSALHHLAQGHSTVEHPGYGQGEHSRYVSARQEVNATGPIELHHGVMVGNDQTQDSHLHLHTNPETNPGVMQQMSPGVREMAVAHLRDRHPDSALALADKVQDDHQMPANYRRGDPTAYMLHDDLRPHLERMGADITPLEDGGTRVTVPGAQYDFLLVPGPNGLPHVYRRLRPNGTHWYAEPADVQQTFAAVHAQPNPRWHDVNVRQALHNLARAERSVAVGPTADGQGFRWAFVNQGVHGENGEPEVYHDVALHNDVTGGAASVSSHPSRFGFRSDHQPMHPEVQQLAREFLHTGDGTLARALADRVQETANVPDNYARGEDRVGYADDEEDDIFAKNRAVRTEFPSGEFGGKPVVGEWHADPDLVLRTVGPLGTPGSFALSHGRPAMIIRYRPLKYLSGDPNEVPVGQWVWENEAFHPDYKDDYTAGKFHKEVIYDPKLHGHLPRVGGNESYGTLPSDQMDLSHRRALSGDVEGENPDFDTMEEPERFASAARPVSYAEGDRQDLLPMFRAIHPAAWRSYQDPSQAPVDLTPRLAAADLLDEQMSRYADLPGADHATVENLLAQLASPEHNQTRWGRGDHNIRMVVADALRDNGRDAEADWLADPDRHVVTDGVAVYPGRMNTAHLQSAIDRLGNILDEYGYADPEQGPPTDYIDIFRSTEEPSDQHFTVGENFNGSQDSYHASEIGPTVAQWMRNHIDFVNQNVLDDLDPEELGDLSGLHAAVDGIEHAPFEEIDDSDPQVHDLLGEEDDLAPDPDPTQNARADYAQLPRRFHEAMNADPSNLAHSDALIDHLHASFKPHHAAVVEGNALDFDDNGVFGLHAGGPAGGEGDSWLRINPQGFGGWWNGGDRPRGYTVQLHFNTGHNPHSTHAFAAAYDDPREAKRIVEGLLAEGSRMEKDDGPNANWGWDILLKHAAEHDALDSQTRPEGEAEYARRPARKPFVPPPTVVPPTTQAPPPRGPFPPRPAGYQGRDRRRLDYAPEDWGPPAEAEGDWSRHDRVADLLRERDARYEALAAAEQYPMYDRFMGATRDVHEALADALQDADHPQYHVALGSLRESGNLDRVFSRATTHYDPDPRTGDAHELEFGVLADGTPVAQAGWWPHSHRDEEGRRYHPNQYGLVATLTVPEAEAYLHDLRRHNPDLARRMVENALTHRWPDRLGAEEDMAPFQHLRQYASPPPEPAPDEGGPKTAPAQASRYDRDAAPTPYSLGAFLQRINEEPEEATHRAVLADWLEENDPGHAPPHVLDFLRTHQGPAWAAYSPDGRHLTPDGRNRLVVGPHLSWADLWDLNGRKYGHGTYMEEQHPSDPFPEVFGFWENADEHEEYPHGEPHSGPGGHYFVTADDPHPFELNDAAAGRSFGVWQFNPATGGVSHVVQTGTPAGAHGIAEEHASGHRESRVSRRLRSIHAEEHYPWFGGNMGMPRGDSRNVPTDDQMQGMADELAQEPPDEQLSRYESEDVPAEYASRHSLPMDPSGYRKPVYAYMNGHYYLMYLVPAVHPDGHVAFWTTAEGQPIPVESSAHAWELSGPDPTRIRASHFAADALERMEDVIMRPLSEHEMYDSGIWQDEHATPLYQHLRENPGDATARHALADRLEELGSDPEDYESAAWEQREAAERIQSRSLGGRDPFPKPPPPPPGPDDVDHNATKLSLGDEPTEYGPEDERLGFETKIQDDPFDGTGHGAYADWLDEQGHADEAKLRRRFAGFLTHDFPQFTPELVRWYRRHPQGVELLWQMFNDTYRDSLTQAEERRGVTLDAGEGEPTEYVWHPGLPESHKHPNSGFQHSPSALYPDDPDQGTWHRHDTGDGFHVLVSRRHDFSGPRIRQGWGADVFDASDISGGILHETPVFDTPEELWRHMIENGVIGRPRVEGPRLEDLDLNEGGGEPTEYAGRRTAWAVYPMPGYADSHTANAFRVASDRKTGRPVWRQDSFFGFHFPTPEGARKFAEAQAGEEAVLDFDETPHGSPVDPRHLWALGLPGGEAPPAPEEPDYRPGGMIPEDFHAMEAGEDPVEYDLEEDRAGFDQAIDQNPFEATNHHAYADWLEENGFGDESLFRRSIANWMQTNPPQYRTNDYGFVELPRDRPWFIPGHFHAGRYPEGVRGVTYDLHGNLLDRHGNIVSGSTQDHHGRFEDEAEANDPNPPEDSYGVSWRNYREMEDALRESFMDGLTRRRQEEAAQVPPPDADARTDNARADYGDAEDEVAFRTQINRDPFELTGHGAFADWLQDRGRDDEADLRRAIVAGMTRRKDTPFTPPPTGGYGFQAAVGPGSHSPGGETPTRPYWDRWISRVYPFATGREVPATQPLSPGFVPWMWTHQSESAAEHATEDAAREAMGLPPGYDIGPLERETRRAARRRPFGPHPDELTPAERAFHGVENVWNMDPAHWEEWERLAREMWGRGKKDFSRYSDDEPRWHANPNLVRTVTDTGGPWHDNRGHVVRLFHMRPAKTPAGWKWAEFAREVVPYDPDAHGGLDTVSVHKVIHNQDAVELDHRRHLAGETEGENPDWDAAEEYLEYSLLPNRHLRPFAEAHWGGDTTAQHSLADNLEEMEDPRGMVILRHLGHTRHPQHDLWHDAGGGYTPSDSNGYLIDPVSVAVGDMRSPEGFSRLTFHPAVAEDETGTPHRSVHVSHRLTRRHPNYDAMTDAGIHGYQEFHHAGNFDEAEARRMADQVPHGYREQIHRMLDLTFPKAPGAEEPPTDEPQEYAWHGVGPKGLRLPPPPDLTRRSPRPFFPQVPL